jgi:two-component system, NarL family, nitrate/nitrite response regulator NarL
VMLGETILPVAMLSMVIDRAANADDDDDRVTVARAAETAVEDATESRGMPQLSDREKCILNYLIEGESNKSIARKIEIAEATVKVHVKAILRKIRVQNRTQAAIWAMSNGSSITAIGKNSALTAQAAVPAPIVADLAPEISPRRRNGA